MLEHDASSLKVVTVRLLAQSMQVALVKYRLKPNCSRRTVGLDDGTIQLSTIVLPVRGRLNFSIYLNKHLTFEIEGNQRLLPYTYQVAGKHPATGFSSPSFQPHTRSGGCASNPARLYLNGRAMVEEPQGSPDCWNAGLLTRSCARSPVSKKAVVQASP